MKKFQPDQNCLLMSRDEARAFDVWAINDLGIPGIVLMENAGRSCAQFIIETLSKVKKPKVCIFCGTGNNGGDGFVIARHLLNAGFAVTVVVCGNIAKIRGENGTEIEAPFFRNSAIFIQIDNVDQNTGWASSPSKTIRLFLPNT